MEKGLVRGGLLNKKERREGPRGQNCPFFLSMINFYYCCRHNVCKTREVLANFSCEFRIKGTTILMASSTLKSLP